MIFFVRALVYDPWRDFFLTQSVYVVFEKLSPFWVHCWYYSYPWLVWAFAAYSWFFLVVVGEGITDPHTPNNIERWISQWGKIGAVKDKSNRLQSGCYLFPQRLKIKWFIFSLTFRSLWRTNHTKMGVM